MGRDAFRDYILHGPFIRVDGSFHCSDTESISAATVICFFFVCLFVKCFTYFFIFCLSSTFNKKQVSPKNERTSLIWMITDESQGEQTLSTMTRLTH